MTAPAKEFYSPKEVAAITGLGESTVRKYIGKGTIPATKLGGRWLISIAVLNSLIK
jgi:excisionase family DNA binding protein